MQFNVLLHRSLQWFSSVISGCWMPPDTCLPIFTGLQQYERQSSETIIQISIKQFTLYNGNLFNFSAPHEKHVKAAGFKHWRYIKLSQQLAVASFLGLYWCQIIIREVKPWRQYGARWKSLMLAVVCWRG